MNKNTNNEVFIYVVEKSKYILASGTLRLPRS